MSQDNIDQSSASIDPASNRLQSQNGTPTVTYSYDATGNLIGDGRFSHRYNAAGRRIASTDATSGQTVSYGYDALGQRIGKTANGLTTQYFYDEQGHLTGEYDSTGQWLQEIVWLGDLPVAVLKPATGATGATDIYYLHADHLGTPRKITRPGDNKAVWTWESEAFGNSLPEQNPAGLGSFVFNLRFPGQYYDQETGLFYNVFRDYDAATGRYIQSDPIGLAGGINTYGYIGGNLVYFVDPLGLQSTSEPIKIPIPVPKIPLPSTRDETDSSPSKDIGEFVQGCYDAIDKIFNDEIPCDPPEGTICSEFHSGGTPHKVIDFEGNKLPAQDWHVHTWQMNKTPSGNCVWNKRRAQKYTFNYTPVDAKSCSSYSTWHTQTGK